MNFPPRPSSLHETPEEWRITEDGYPFKDGDRLFNYYDRKWGTVQLDTYVAAGEQEWFDFIHEDGTTTALNASRVAKNEPK